MGQVRRERSLNPLMRVQNWQDRKNRHSLCQNQAGDYFNARRREGGEAETGGVKNHALTSGLGGHRRAGAAILKSAGDTCLGGYSGYFQDPDGRVWEIAWHPAWKGE